MKFGRKLTEEIVFMYPAYKTFVDKQGCLAAQVLKAVYGSIQAAKLWYDHITGVLIEIGFSINAFDHATRVKCEGDNYAIIVLRVDDLFITSNDAMMLAEVKDEIEARFQGRKVQKGKQFDYLGRRLLLRDGETQTSMTGSIDE